MGCGSSKRVGSAADGHGSAADTGTGEACQVIDGRAIAQKRLATIKAAIEAVGTAAPRPPKLVVVLVGSNAASLSYIKQKKKAAVACGIAVELRTLEATVPQSDVEELVRQLNADDGVDGVIVQLPLPDHMDGGAMTQLVAHRKDVDGFTGQSIGSVALDGQDARFCPCTPLGCLELIKSTGVTLRGKEAVVVGAGRARMVSCRPRTRPRLRTVRARACVCVCVCVCVCTRACVSAPSATPTHPSTHHHPTPFVISI